MRHSNCFLEKYFKKILIANRGEIACRVMKTCRRLEIPSVAIYSTADARSKFVSLADEAYCVGPPLSAESYLRIDKILDVIKKCGADAVHPGYGFLSENSAFSKALYDNGVTFIGPKESAIQAMGDKIESKKLAQKLGVNIIPGYNGEIENEDHLLKVANEIGYPVMMKASAGGGGKGMRIANNDEEAISGFRLSKKEAKASFGDDRMLVEKFIEEPRHIEIQVIADKVGNCLWLPERECSIQRRNQKVVEEAPSTFIDDETRRAMGEQAVMLARGVEYHTAGTVEMMVDKNRNFYFLEMNTRLQVEHPITELITGIDLVEEMIRAASGNPLSVRQSDIKINGWATESRVYAEDPLNNFLPVIGRLNKYEEPVGEGVRVDSGILEGSEISMYYDPLISKLCTWAPTRNECIQKMNSALDSYVIRGLARNNINFLRDIMLHPRYLSGKFTTKFIDEEYKNGYKGHVLTENEERDLLVVATIAHTLIDASSYYGLSHPSQQMKNLSKRWVAQHGGVSYLIHVQSTSQYSDEKKRLPTDMFKRFSLSLLPLVKKDEKGDHCSVPYEVPYQRDLLNALFNCNISPDSAFLNNYSFNPDLKVDITYDIDWDLTQSLLHYYEPGSSVKRIAQIVESTDGFNYTLQLIGSNFSVKVMSPLEYGMSEHMIPPPESDLSKEIRSPMPGVVVDVTCKVGDKVKPGQSLIVLEAMKMRNVLNATHEGIVKSINIPIGESVDDGTTLIVLE